jgi:dihydrofolate reductase
VTTLDLKPGGDLILKHEHRRTSWDATSSAGMNEQMRAHPIGVALNEVQKYVASNTMLDPTWPEPTLLSGDIAAAIRKLKSTPGGELQVHESGALIRWLLANDLIDELTLLTVPVVLGQGTRLFPESGIDIALDLVDSRTDTKGVIVQVYRPTGRPQYHPVRPA